jgi:tuberculosinol/isotuberculosinol synthase
MQNGSLQDLSTAEVAELVRSMGPKTCAFPINGTRRWFLLEYPAARREDYAEDYLRMAGRRHLELYGLLFNHGIHTLLTPIFGPDLLDRGEKYADMATEGLAILARNPSFLQFYQDYQVRVRFYGDYRRFFASSPYAYLPDLFDATTEETKNYERCRLFFGVCAHDAAETIARLAVQYHTENGHVPTKRSLVELYYGEYVEPVDLFIGFDKFCVFDMPLVVTGNEDLYFTVSPSPYLTEQQLREILSDHLYARRGEAQDYTATDSDEWRFMADFYRANMGRTLGVGKRRGGVWFPVPQVELPSGDV